MYEWYMSIPNQRQRSLADAQPFSAGENTEDRNMTAYYRTYYRSYRNPAWRFSSAAAHHRDSSRTPR